MSETELRARLRGYADDVLSDAFITYVAMLREQGLVDATTGVLALDEMSAALADQATTLRTALEIVREGGPAAGDPLQVASLSLVVEGEIESLIEDRRTALREADGAA